MLNNIDGIRAIDPDGMAKLIASFPEQIPTGRRLATEIDLSAIDASLIGNIIVCGMGGSAIGGDLVRAFSIDRLNRPMFVNRDYDLPAFVGKRSLVIGTSYSGNTEETLECFGKSGARGAQRIAITTGGKLAKIAEQKGIPLIILPGGLPPRAALGYSFSPILTIIERLGFIGDIQAEFEEMIEVLEKGLSDYGVEIPIEQNDSKSIAISLHNRLPLIYSDNRHFDSVAVRFRGQINENAKQLAFSAVLPENNHNELVGWKNLGVPAENLISVIMTDFGIDPRVRFRMEFLSKTQAESSVETVALESRGEGLLARMFSLIQLGDWISYYMAILNRVDPMPVEIIDRLKASLADFNETRIPG